MQRIPSIRRNAISCVISDVPCEIDTDLLSMGRAIAAVQMPPKISDTPVYSATEALKVYRDIMALDNNLARHFFLCSFARKNRHMYEENTYDKIQRGVSCDEPRFCADSLIANRSRFTPEQYDKIVAAFCFAQPMTSVPNIAI